MLLDAMDALALNGVSLTYPAARRQPPRHALREITLTVQQGRWVALLGPNGSGKSSLMRVITGITPPSAGTVLVMSRHPAEARAQMSVVFQHPGLDRHMTVWENLHDSAALYGMFGRSAGDRILSLLTLLKVDDRRDAMVKTLSGGLARRVDLCRALLSQPTVLLMDEPTTGLDPSARRDVLDALEALHRNDGALTIVMSTHLIDEAERADRVLMMHEGRVVADGSPATLRASLGVHRITVHDASWHPPADQSESWSRSRAGWTCDLNDRDASAHIASRLALEAVPFSIAPPTLADAFEHYTESPLDAETLDTTRNAG